MFIVPVGCPPDNPAHNGPKPLNLLAGIGPKPLLRTVLKNHPYPPNYSFPPTRIVPAGTVREERTQALKAIICLGAAVKLSLIGFSFP